MPDNGGKAKIVMSIAGLGAAASFLIALGRALRGLSTTDAPVVDLLADPYEDSGEHVITTDPPLEEGNRTQGVSRDTANP